MISGLIYAVYLLLFDPYPWASLGSFLEVPFQFFQGLGL